MRNRGGASDAVPVVSAPDARAHSAPARLLRILNCVSNPGTAAFNCYIVSSQTPNAPIEASLEDQFQTAVVSVGEPLQFCNPVQKTIEEVVTPIEELNNHLTMYSLVNAAPLPAPRTFIATNQFGDAQFTVDKATILLVPTQKNDVAFPRPERSIWKRSADGNGS